MTTSGMGKVGSKPARAVIVTASGYWVVIRNPHRRASTKAGSGRLRWLIE